MNWRAIWTIVLKDLRVVQQSRAVMIPLIVVPLIFLAILPAVGGALLSGVDEDSAMIADSREEFGLFFDNLPENLQGEFDEWDNDVQRLVLIIFVYMMAALFLIVPIMVANVIAADSFVGEKERKTLEALIYSPTTDRELYIAKLLAPWLAALAVSFIGFLLYALILNVTAYPVMERVFFPNLTWLLLVFWVAPAAAGIGLGVMVLVSSRVNTFQEAYQLGGMIVIPVVLLVFGQISGVLYFSPLIVVLLGLLLWLVDAAIIYYGAQTFRRGALITRL